MDSRLSQRRMRRGTELAGEPANQQTGRQPDQQAGVKPGEETGRARRGTFRALHSKPFRLYFAGQVASASGTFLQQTAMGWLVLKLTGNAASLGLVLAAGGVPSLLFGPWGGTIADRPRRSASGRWPARSASAWSATRGGST